MPSPAALRQVPSEAVEAFIARWKTAGGSERANYQLFLTELVALLDLPRPDPASDDTRDNAYVFERRVTFRHGNGEESSGFVDLYRRGAFVLEAKKLRQKGAGTQVTLETGDDEETPTPVVAEKKVPWPKDLTEQVKAVASALTSAASPQSSDDIAARFTGRGPKQRVPQLLDMLAALGRARDVGEGRYVG